QIATLDQVAEGRLILGVGIARDVASIRGEFAAAGVPFEKRIGRLLEGLRLAKALWRGPSGDLGGRWGGEGTPWPEPHRARGPPVWIAGSLPASLERAGKTFDGWIPNVGDACEWGRQWAQIRTIAAQSGRDPHRLTGAMYLTLSVDEDVGRANQRLDSYLERYYEQPAAVLRGRQECYAGPPSGLAAYLGGYRRAGANHLILRFAGDHERHLAIMAAVKAKL